jgi:hypothetical protein
MNAKYPLPIALVLKGVRENEDILDKVANLKFMDHNIKNTQKFLELDRDKYLWTKNDPERGKTWVEAQEWASSLEKSEILNLFKIPHLGCSNEIDAHVKVFLIFIHWGKILLDLPVSIDTMLIACIIGLRKAGEDSSLLFLKMGERALSETIKYKYDTFIGKHGLDVKKINEKEAKFTK